MSLQTYQLLAAAPMTLMGEQFNPISPVTPATAPRELRIAAPTGELDCWRELQQYWGPVWHCPSLRA